MTAIALPDLDRSTVDDFRKKIPNLTELELPNMPSMQKVGKTADETIDRLLGRSRAPVWPWVVAGIGLVAIVGLIAAWFAWFRRPSWDGSAQEGWSTEATTTDDDNPIETDSLVDRPAAGTGLTAAESSLSSAPYPVEEA